MGCGASQSASVVHSIPHIKVLTSSAYCQTDAYNVEALARALPDTEDAGIGAQSDLWEPDTTPLLEAEVAAAMNSAPPRPASNKKKPDKKQSAEDTWHAVCQTLDVPKGKKNPNANLVVKRTGWKTIRIFVSSTFKDFQREREALVKEVFPDLRAWCESRRLHLVECDLRWGVPKDSTTELTLRTCLGEIDRCYQDNIMPYFLNMTSERIGWIPEPGEVPQNLVDEYRWIFGLSVTEMEIVHGAYRKDNPNSLFLIRNDSFLETLPAEARKLFIDENPLAPAKLDVLRKMIKDRFPNERVVSYGCEYTGQDSKTGKVQLSVDPTFSERVFSFFKERIASQYPLLDQDDNPFERTREAHEAFMKSRCDAVLGRASVIQQINDYIGGVGNDVPLLVLGGPGTGKSSILAKAMDETVTNAHNNKIAGGHGEAWHVFHHFVGAVPGSTDIRNMLRRLLYEIKVADESDMPSDLDTIVQLTCSALNNPSTRPVVIMIDALNQLDDEEAAKLMTWVPRKLAPQVRCVFAMINDTPTHVNLKDRESKPIEIFVTPLSLQVRKDMVTEYLGKFNKRLDLDQMICLLTKSSSVNPLWVSIACEELRVFGNFREVSDKINSLADGLLELLQQVLSRFEEEGGGHLLVATLCLLEVSLTGLLESELLAILADEDNIMPSDGASEKGIKESSEKAFKPCGNLPAFKWAGVYRALRPFLRPFGDSGEGRLDFYHRSLSKAIRKKYLEKEGDGEDLGEHYRWWHKKLADYFHQSDNYDRKVEEFPYHLIKLKDLKRLEELLGDWQAFDRLFDKEFSPKLLKYWRECGGTERMQDCYSEKLRELMNDPNTNEETLAKRYEAVSRFLVQGGIYDPALDLANEALAIEQKLGSRPERLVELYSIMATVWDAKMKLHEFCTRDQIPEEKETMKYNEFVIDMIQKFNMTSKYHQTMLAMQQMKLAFCLASFADCGGDETLNVQQSIDKGNEMVDKAISLFKMLQDNGHLAEAIMTKAVLCRGNVGKQLKYYEEAMDLCKQTYGHYHVLTGRMYMNTGICYEDTGNYHKSYDYFRIVYLINKEVYGPEHIKTKRNRGVLTESMYRSIARQRNDTEILALTAE